MTDTALMEQISVRLAAVFLPSPVVPREGRVAFWDPDGERALPEAEEGVEQTELTVVRRHGAGVRRRPTPALTLPIEAALPLLVRARWNPAA
ncbi:hypothetical protein R6V09_53830, partial [Streptomyces sp. W16]|uniref:hypothetical protein n=1 Tax=Streptomyces sp. W16 TaxID=3076631 RepID=UPI00295C04BC